MATPEDSIPFEQKLQDELVAAANRRDVRYYKTGLAVIFGGMALSIAGALVYDAVFPDTKPVPTYDPAQTYIESFTQDGQCLDGTEFDADKGIQTFVEEKDGQNVLGIRPVDSSGYNYVLPGHPDTLYFVVDADGKVTAKDPHFADVHTAGFLADNNCDLPDGM